MTVLERGELIRLLAHLAAPLTPFTLEGAPEDEALFIDWLEQRSQEQFDSILDEAVEAFIDVVTHPPAPADAVPPARNEAFWRAELMNLAERFGQTPYEPRILQGLEPALKRPGARLLAMEVLGRMKSPTALARLRELAAEQLTLEEKLLLIAAIAESGGAEARALLEMLRECFAETAVRSAIAARLGRWRES